MKGLSPGAFHCRPHTAQFLFRSQGDVLSGLINRDGSDFQYPGQSPRPVQKPLLSIVGQTDLRVPMGSLGLPSQLYKRADNCRGRSPSRACSFLGLLRMLGSIWCQHPRGMGTTFPFSILCMFKFMTLGLQLFSPFLQFPQICGSCSILIQDVLPHA